MINPAVVGFSNYDSLKSSRPLCRKKFDRTPIPSHASQQAPQGNNKPPGHTRMHPGALSLLIGRHRRPLIVLSYYAY